MHEGKGPCPRQHHLLGDDCNNDQLRDKHERSFYMRSMLADLRFIRMVGDQLLAILLLEKCCGGMGFMNFVRSLLNNQISSTRQPMSR